eukprot:tig00000079_g2790.t1
MFYSNELLTKKGGPAPLVINWDEEEEEEVERPRGRRSAARRSASAREGERDRERLPRASAASSHEEITLDEARGGSQRAAFEGFGTEADLGGFGEFADLQLAEDIFGVGAEAAAPPAPPDEPVPEMVAAFDELEPREADEEAGPRVPEGRARPLRGGRAAAPGWRLAGRGGAGHAGGGRARAKRGRRGALFAEETELASDFIRACLEERGDITIAPENLPFLRPGTAEEPDEAPPRPAPRSAPRPAPRPRLTACSRSARGRPTCGSSSPSARPSSSPPSCAASHGTLHEPFTTPASRRPPRSLAGGAREEREEEAQAAFAPLEEAAVEEPERGRRRDEDAASDAGAARTVRLRTTSLVASSEGRRGRSTAGVLMAELEEETGPTPSSAPRALPARRPPPDAAQEPRGALDAARTSAATGESSPGSLFPPVDVPSFDDEARRSSDFRASEGAGGAGGAGRSVSETTVKMVGFLEERMEGRASLSLLELLRGESRVVAARTFFQILVLATGDAVRVEQEEPYGDISIAPGRAFRTFAARPRPSDASAAPQAGPSSSLLESA